ncbi:MAG: hypothetical protein A3C70_03115 [Candidatus Zambryskibacteria bacterium RIFCSPHIGHO2_02_FULL_43_14]|uniref:Uncharacterized protein n=1 Tax=Candidatus Zambryskibacteria bacterium RIFCSPHIGHO2_02_FULL_43_14 TaxID=1802748 RepID=A0A1G2TGR9_9BACT|nr:MAG: hypothetical protein A2829_02175 [Candidatus Zambryskibacteria bacterium RIFCSPHIGHO2_01_FULL_43_60]OHA96238.1 MAG: hypothetical protein A3C70_03115 [Candidatus Zambryskibacteria bacterium RIFCSPHIGHO2_02_FULL_43_14]OHB04095.1 MAG: hypothetical protein A3B03_01425 [Candidatus Zambryskibacteria bacterium RIFCSPLOWO2_01_FULL_42_41]
MKILLVVTNTRGKNLVFVPDALTAISLEKAIQLASKGEIYNPNPDDKKLPFKRMNLVARRYLYAYLVQSKHSIFFAAAFVRHVINFWASKIDLQKKSEIIGTLYHKGYGER